MKTRQQALLDLQFEADAAEPSVEEIQQRYKKLALQYHPDKNNDAYANFQRINSAYEFLIQKDTVSFTTYDEEKFTVVGFLNSLYSHLFALEENNHKNNRYLYQCIDASVNIARLLQDYMYACSESWSSNETIRKAQLINALNFELQKFSENGGLKIQDPETLELAKILLRHFSYLRDPINNFKSTEDTFTLAMLDDAAQIAIKCHQQLLSDVENAKVNAHEQNKIEIKLFITKEINNSQNKISEQKINVPIVNIDSSSSEYEIVDTAGMDRPIEPEENNEQNEKEIVKEKSAITIENINDNEIIEPELPALRLPPVPRIQPINERQALKILSAPMTTPSEFFEHVKSDADIIIEKYKIKLEDDRKNSFFPVRSNFLNIENKTLERIIQHSMTGGTFGNGKNRTWQVIKDEGWIDDFNNPTKNCSVDFRRAWNKTHKIKIVKDLLKEEVARLRDDKNWENCEIKLATYLMLIQMISQSHPDDSIGKILQEAKDKKLEAAYLKFAQAIRNPKVKISLNEIQQKLYNNDLEIKVKTTNENPDKYLVDQNPEVKKDTAMIWVDEEYVETRKTNESGQASWEKVTRNKANQITIGDALTWRQFKYNLFSSKSAGVWKNLCDTYCDPRQENNNILVV